MWMDELNSWDIARDAHSLRQLFANMHWESHPALWYLCLYPLTALTANPRAMQVLHLAIATGTAALIAWSPPFTRLERWLLAFGYFFVFEFAVVSRGYALGVLLALATCAVYFRARRSIAAIGILMALLANTSVYGLFMTVALGTGMLADDRLRRDASFWTAVVFVAAAGVVSLTTLYPAPDNVFAREWHRFDWGRVEGLFVLAMSAYVPLPDLGVPSPWNTNILMDEAVTFGALPRGLLAAGLGVVLIAATIWAFRRHRAALTIYLVGAASILIFVYVKYSGGLRHHGHLFIVTILALWVARRGMPPARSSRALVAVLACQLIAGIYFVADDLRNPFSFSKELADYVRTLPKAVPVVVAQHAFLNMAGPPLSGYLQRPVTYVLAHRIVRGSFLETDAEHQRGATEHEITVMLRRFADERGTDVYVVTNNWQPTSFGPALAHFDRHIEGDERTADVFLFRR